NCALRPTAAPRVDKYSEDGPEPGTVRRPAVPEVAKIGSPQVPPLQRFSPRARTSAARGCAATLRPAQVRAREAGRAVRNGVVRQALVRAVRMPRPGPQPAHSRGAGPGI